MALLYRIIILLAISAMFLVIVLYGNAFAKNVSFSWDHNHPNDGAVNYRLYWRSTTQEWDELRTLDTGYVNEFTAYDMPNEMTCYVLTAMDSNNYESDYSNEVCSSESIRFKIR